MKSLSQNPERIKTRCCLHKKHPNIEELFPGGFTGSSGSKIEVASWGRVIETSLNEAKKAILEVLKEEQITQFRIKLRKRRE